MATTDGPKSQPVNATVVLPDGREVFGAAGLRGYLANERKHEFARSLVSHLLSYALGRSLELTDKAAVDRVLDQFAKDNYRIKGLVHKLVSCEPFQTK
jgi:hypothetical protein